MSVMPWYERYFIGGYTSAGKITKDKREEKRNELYQKLITLIASTKK